MGFECRAYRVRGAAPAAQRVSLSPAAPAGRGGAAWVEAEPAHCAGRPTCVALVAFYGAALQTTTGPGASRAGLREEKRGGRKNVGGGCAFACCLAICTPCSPRCTGQRCSPCVPCCQRGIPLSPRSRGWCDGRACTCRRHSGRRLRRRGEFVFQPPFVAGPCSLRILGTASALDCPRCTKTSGRHLVQPLSLHGTISPFPRFAPQSRAPAAVLQRAHRSGRGCTSAARGFRQWHRPSASWR